MLNAVFCILNSVCYTLYAVPPKQRLRPGRTQLISHSPEHHKLY